jgi:cytochrome c-type biogenesis protein CcmE
MTRKRRRLIALGIGLSLLAAATALVLTAFNDNLVFFYSPSELAEKSVGQMATSPGAIGPGRRIRIGGLVEPQSLRRQPDGHEIDFRVTDGKTTVAVVYNGALPDLFREGQGVVAEGRLRPDGVFAATSVLAKHDEKYMPPEVADALKKSGRWQEGGTQEAAPAAAATR